MPRHEIHATQRLTRLQSPDSAGGVDRRCADEIGIYFVPVKRRERCTEVAVFVVVEHAFHAGFWFAGAPHSQVIAAGR